MIAWIIVAVLVLVILVLAAFLLRYKWRAALSQAQGQINQLRQQVTMQKENTRRVGRTRSGLALRERPNKADEFTVTIPKAKFDQAANWDSRSRITKRGGLEITFKKNEDKK